LNTRGARLATIRQGLPAGWIGPVALALLAYAGAIKNSPLLAWVPLDLTIILAVLIAAAILHSCLTLGPPPPTVIWPLSLFAIFLLGAFDPQFSGYPFSKVMALFTFTAVAVIAPFFLLRTEVQRRLFVGTLATLALSVAVTIFVKPGVVGSSSNVVTLEGTNTISTARMLATGIVIFVALAMVGSGRTQRRLGYGALGGALVLSALSTGSRGPFLAVGIAVFAIIVGAPALRSNRLPALLTSGLLALVALLAASAAGGDGVSRVFGLLSGGVDNSVRVRGIFLSEALDKIAETPFGIGWGNFIQLSDMSLYAKGGDRLYPHNVIVETTLEAGWIAGVVVTAFMIASIVRASRAATSPVPTVVFGLLLFAVVNALTSGDVNDNRSLWMLLSAAWVVPSLSATTPRSGLHPALEHSGRPFTQELGALPSGATYSGR
jgi:hypothetical protein